MFTQANNIVIKSIKQDDDPELVEKKFDDLSRWYTDVQDKYISSIEDEADFDQLESGKWMDDVEDQFAGNERMYHGYLKS